MADMTLGKGVDDMVGPDVQVSERIQQAMDMAKAFHEGQMRRGNGGMKPYYDEHILGVYNILREECGITDEDILITALLHDTVDALSRLDNESLICPDCGTREALDSIGVSPEEQDAIIQTIHRYQRSE